MMRQRGVFRILEFIPQQLAIPLGVVLLAIIGHLDYLNGYHMSLSLFYLIPIYLVTARTGRRNGIIISILAAAVLLWVELAVRPMEMDILVIVWNVVLRWGFFLLVALALSELQNSFMREAVLSRSDPTTGLANSRSFTEQLEAEIARLRRYRHPFSLAYLDLDNFKTINDNHGHSAGDQVLSHVAKVLKESTRTLDDVARLGGDEFAILFPETGLPEAQHVLQRFREHLEHSVGTQYGRITMSIGLVTFTEAPKSAQEALKIADDLMYTVKHGAKDGIQELTRP